MSGSAFSGRMAVVTGASAGIGLAVVHLLASRACRVVVNARRADKLEQLAQTCTPLVRPVAGDCADDGTISGMLDAARSFSPTSREADLVVINAGRGLNGSVMTSDSTQWEEMIRTNFLGAAKLLRSAAARMLGEINAPGAALLDRPRDIVILGSTVGRHVSPFSSMYGSTKFGLHGLAEGARRELGPKGIRVSLIEPGFVESEFQGVAGYNPEWVGEVFARIGPVLQPQDVARLVAFICEQPPHVHISDQLIRPTRQDYP
jgi:NADP-dependent 3-hydroxy acid dehydrogenase YdfG